MMDKISGTEKILVFTAVDDLFSKSEDPSYEKAISAIDNLRKLAIPLIAVTTKTNAQIQNLRLDLGLTAPAIVEHGSGVVISQADKEFNNSDPDLDASAERDWQVKKLGCTYVEARAALKVIQSVVRINNLRGFGDLGVAEIEKITGLPKSEIKQIKTRNFSEIFVTPKSVDPQEIIATATEFGFNSLMGENLSCLVGASASVATAIDWLKVRYERSQPATKITTVGLGFNSSDLEMLNVVDMPVVVNNQAVPNSFSQDWSRSEAIGLAGWAETVTKICANYGGGD